MTKMTNTVQYVWRGNSGAGDGPTAQAVGERLALIERKKGTLQAKHVLDDARSSKSPLHRYFEWDDGKAAEAYRLNQARHLIQIVHVKTVGNRDLQKPARAFVSLRPDAENDRQYENIVSVMSDDMKRVRLLKMAKEELADWRNRYETLQEFADLFPVIDRAIAA